MKPKAHVAEYKKKNVEDIIKLVEKYPIIATVNMQCMPAPQLQKMREQLRGKVLIRMDKRRIVNIALDKAKEKKPGIEKLKEYLEGMPALIFTNENPFSLCKTLQKNKSTAPAKPGQIAPKDIIIPAGPTSFAPGPIIGELGQAGLKAGIEGGKVAIKESKVVTKKGEQVTEKVAAVLTKLGIQPMEIGLGLVAVYEKGFIFTRDVLSIDEQQYLNNLTKASSWAFNLAVDIAYPTKDTISLLMQTAFLDAEYLALSKNIISDVVVKQMVSEANQQMLNLKNLANLPEPKTEPPKEKVQVEKQAETKKETTEKKENKGTDEKIREMVQEAQKFETRVKKPSAKVIVEEVVKEVETSKAKEKPKDKVPSAAELAARKKS